MGSGRTREAAWSTVILLMLLVGLSIGKCPAVLQLAKDADEYFWALLHPVEIFEINRRIR
jgi:hypothetical protein